MNFTKKGLCAFLILIPTGLYFNYYHTATKIIVGASFALPAAALCLCIQVEQMTSLRFSGFSDAQKRRRRIWEVILCFFLPVLIMGLRELTSLAHVARPHHGRSAICFSSGVTNLTCEDSIVQGHRFDIFQYYGCRAAIYWSVPAIMIINVPQIIVSVAAFIYSGTYTHSYPPLPACTHTNLLLPIRLRTPPPHLLAAQLHC